MFVFRIAEFKSNFLATSAGFEILESMSLPPPRQPPEDPDPNLGEAIRALREQRSISRAELAARSGVDETAVAAIEAGTTDPNWATVEALAGALGVSMEQLATAVVARDPGAP